MIISMVRLIPNVTGAQWAKEYLDPSWSGLIDRTWATRPNPAKSVRQPADPEDFERTLAFVRFVIGEVTMDDGRLTMDD